MFTLLFLVLGRGYLVCYSVRTLLWRGSLVEKGVARDHFGDCLSSICISIQSTTIIIYRFLSVCNMINLTGR
uniref:Uncharacterized protein n=1 Tax=Helianthus annuus TaxID=4232 RepID=A0A251TJH7_HELAN